MSLFHAGEVYIGPVLRRGILGTPLQAAAVACTGGTWIWRRQGLGRV